MTGTEQMYHQQQIQSENQHLSSRPVLPPEKQFLLQGGTDSSSGLVLSTDAKPRLKWTSELHERFVDAVTQLGGPDKATPKTIMRLMGIPGLTLYHLKSHLQKYRLSKNLQSQANASRAQGVLGCSAMETDKPCEGNGSPASHLDLEMQTSSSVHISEALQMQIEVQRRLHEQLEVQRHLQLRIEAQGKYLQSVLEKAQEALGTIGVAEAAANTSPSKRLQNEHSHRHQQQQQQQVGDGSVDSCLTACDCDGSHHRGGGGRGGDQDVLSIGLPPFEPARSGRDTEHYLLFPDEPSTRRPCSEERRREIRRDGFNSGSITLQASELDLNINDGSSSGRYHSHRRERIDLNGSGWN
ncbi:myb-related protein 1-like isoform X2 [Oryza brachyantha]|uniref:HTH myb-type domain-containing protein n=1 Tax=Oryza brachyantha TaxID=4533 RepID=J3MP89_ORYBR|nr:myb-related protein 1-like isoform X2 [Oryza brachyantha]